MSVDQCEAVTCSARPTLARPPPYSSPLDYCALAASLSPEAAIDHRDRDTAIVLETAVLERAVRSTRKADTPAPKRTAVHGQNVPSKIRRPHRPVPTYRASAPYRTLLNSAAPESRGPVRRRLLAASIAQRKMAGGTFARREKRAI